MSAWKLAESSLLTLANARIGASNTKVARAVLNFILKNDHNVYYSVVIIKADTDAFMGGSIVALTSADANDHFEPTKTID